MAKPQNENQLIRSIERVFPQAKSSRLSLALGDDAALFRPRQGYETILTCDWFLEGSHFLREKHPADSVGWKSLARAVSDIAAMGGTPRCFLLSLSLPGDSMGDWLTGFLRGLRRASEALNCELAGGDTTRRNEILINMSVVGEVRSGTAIRRDRAKAGDQIFATGTLGEGELGLEMLRGEKGFARVKNKAMRKHLYPVPRLEVGRWLAEKRLAGAMMDLSDGLSTDLQRLCSASEVGARIEAEKLPVSSLVGPAKGVRLALHGGDDYELLFVVRPGKVEQIPREYRGVTLTRIGEITAKQEILVEEAGRERPLLCGGWDPFRVDLDGKKNRNKK